jgi:hypothetical protein
MRYGVSMLLIGSMMPVHAVNWSTVALGKLEQTTQSFMSALKGYRECALKGACTAEQRTKLRQLGVAIGMAAIAAVGGFLGGKVTQHKMGEIHAEDMEAVSEACKDKMKNQEIRLGEDCIVSFQRLQMESGQRERDLKNTIKYLNVEINRLKDQLSAQSAS